MEKKFKIDFIELSFLAEACIPPRPIARAMFWDDLIEKYYHDLTQNERNNLFEWMNRNSTFQHSLENKNEDCYLFNARFDPNNQYLVTTVFGGKEETKDCFKWQDRHHISRNKLIVEEYITKIEKTNNATTK